MKLAQEQEQEREMMNKEKSKDKDYQIVTSKLEVDDSQFVPK